jgi:hypothetical protein
VLRDRQKQGLKTLLTRGRPSYGEGMRSLMEGSVSGRKTRRWFASIAVTSAATLAAAYLLDPERGRGRRQRLAGRASHFLRTSFERAGRRASYLRRSARLRRLHAEHGFPPKPVDGRTLLDRVESELFTDPRIPHGKLNLEVEGSVVVIRGALESKAEIETVEGAVRGIPGVYAVRSFLHVSGTPAPNKVAALRASSRALQFGGWPPEPPPDVDSQTALV